jgi:ACR3 family arsenite transporter
MTVPNFPSQPPSARRSDFPSDLPTTSPEIQTDADIEKHQDPNDASLNCENCEREKTSAFKSLGWLDRFLAVWIFLAMAVGIILGNFVPSTGPALQKGKFVGVSVPIGMYPFPIPRNHADNNSE